MSRLVACVLAAVVALAIAPAPVADASPAQPAIAAQSGGDAPASPDIIPDPDGPSRPSNARGLIVALVLFGGWVAGSVVLLRRGRRSKAGP